MNRVKLNTLEETLFMACKYFEGKADVDHNGHMFISNEEAQLWRICEDTLVLVQHEIIEDMTK